MVTIEKNIEALLVWRKLPITQENILKINKKDYFCSYNAFAEFTILRKKINLEKYRQEYERITGESWEMATIQKIFKADLVW